MRYSTTKDQRPAVCIRKDLSLVLLTVLHNSMPSVRLIIRSQCQILPFSHLAWTTHLAKYWHYFVLVLIQVFQTQVRGGDRYCLAVSHGKQGSLSLLADVSQSLGISTLFDARWRKLFYG